MIRKSHRDSHAFLRPEIASRLLVSGSVVHPGNVVARLARLYRCSAAATPSVYPRARKPRARSPSVQRRVRQAREPQRPRHLVPEASSKRRGARAGISTRRQPILVSPLPLWIWSGVRYGSECTTCLPCRLHDQRLAVFDPPPCRTYCLFPVLASRADAVQRRFFAPIADETDLVRARTFLMVHTTTAGAHAFPLRLPLFGLAFPANGGTEGLSTCAPHAQRP